MLLHVEAEIRHCLDEAAEARQRAQRIVDPARKAEFFDTEGRWLRLAESYRLLRQIDRFVTDTKRQRLTPLRLA
jgi:hypothetical protein